MTDPKPFEWNSGPETFRLYSEVPDNAPVGRLTTEAHLIAALADRPEVVERLAEQLRVMPPAGKRQLDQCLALVDEAQDSARALSAALRYAQEPCAYCMSSDIQRDAAIGERDALQARVAELASENTGLFLAKLSAEDAAIAAKNKLIGALEAQRRAEADRDSVIELCRDYTGGTE